LSAEAYGDKQLFTWDSLEGEYTRWDWIGSTDVFALHGGVTFEIFVDNDGVIYLMDLGGFQFHVYRLLTWVQTLPNMFLWANNYSHVPSVGHKYVAIPNNPPPNQVLTIYRRGVAIFNEAVGLRDPRFQESSNWAFSPNGRYFVLVGRAVGPVSFGYMMVYRGAP